MKKESIVLFLLVPGIMMSGIDTTIVILALPAIMSGLRTDLDAVTWVILIYLIAVTVLGTQCGRLGDIRGRARMFNLGMLIFALSSGLAGASNSIQTLVAFRALQGVGGALMMSNSVALIGDYFKHGRRGYAFGWTTFGWNIGAVIGILLGGFLTSFYSWRWVFYATVPVGGLGFIFGMKYLQESESPVPRRFDLLGSLSIGASLTLLSLGGIQFSGEGLSVQTIEYLSLALLALLIFILLEKRSREPLLDLSLFKVKLFSASMLASYFQSTATFAVLFLLTLYLQGVRGLDPFSASLYLVPSYLAGSLLGAFGGRLADLRDPRVIATLGLGLQASSYVVFFLFLTSSVSLDLVVVASLIYSLGANAFFTSNVKLVMADIPRDKLGMASGTFRTLYNMGFVTSIVVAVVASAAAIPKQAALSIFVGSSVLTPALFAPFIASIRSAFLASTVLMGVAVALSWVRGKVAMQAELQPSIPV